MAAVGKEVRGDGVRRVEKKQLAFDAPRLASTVGYKNAKYRGIGT